MIDAGFIQSVWRARREQGEALAKEPSKREAPPIELTPDEWNLLRKGDDLEREMRQAEAGSQ